MGQHRAPHSLPQQAQRPDLGLTFAEATPATETLLSEDSRQFLTAWKRWRGDRVLPQRREMDLVSIARLMPKMMLLEAFGPQRMMFRLAGGEVEALVGTRLMGRDYIAMAEPAIRTTRGHLLWAAATRPCGLLSFHGFPHPNTGETHQTESFTLPILPNEADAPMQLLTVVSQLPVVADGASTMLPLIRPAMRRHFIDIGAGLPVLNAA